MISTRYTPRSMTGYGKGEASTTEGISWIVEIQSLNRKGLEIYVQMPKGYVHLEGILRKQIQAAIERGQINVRVELKFQKRSVDLLRSLSVLQKDWEEIATHLKMDKKEITLSFLLQRMQEESSLQSSQAAVVSLEKPFLEATQVALDHLLMMKEEEGRILIEDLYRRLQHVEKSLDIVKSSTDLGTEKYRQKLLEKLSLFLKESTEDERLLKEVAFFAEKVDITEELVRLGSHVKQAYSFCFEPPKEGKGRGRAFEFLLQEIQREVNTIGAKAQELTISKEVLQMKGELEKIREQVQNIE